MTKIIKHHVHFRGNSYFDVKITSWGPNLQFERVSDEGRKRMTYIVTPPFTVVDDIKLSCGHKVESFWEKDCGSGGRFARCKECDAEKKS